MIITVAGAKVALHSVSKWSNGFASVCRNKTRRVAKYLNITIKVRADILLGILKNERILRSALLNAESVLQGIQNECTQYRSFPLFEQLMMELSSGLSSIEHLLAEYALASANMPQFDFDVYAPWCSN